MTKHKTEDYKISAVKYYLNNDKGDGYKKTCKIFDCKKSTLRDWIKRYKTLKNLTRRNRKPISYKITKPQVKTALELLKQNEQYLAGCYIISLKGVRTIINWFNSLYYSSDWMTTRLQLNNHSYSFFPWLVIQEGNYSLIQEKVPDEDYAKVVRCLKEINYSLDNYI